MSAGVALARATLALGLVAGVAAAWLVAPAPTGPLVGPELDAQAVAVEARQLRLVCPGVAVRVGGEAGTEVGTIERLGEAQLFIRNSDPAAAVSVQPEFSEFQSFTSDSELEQSSDLLSGWQLQQLAAPRIFGTAATACVSPAREQWFVAGGTGAQDDAVLMVHNPGSVEAAVSVNALGDSSAELDFALAPGGTELVSIATLLPGSDELAVAVNASSPVSSWLQHRTSRGLSATGFDLAPGQPGPAQSIAIAGVSVLGTELAPLAELTTPVVRIYNPASEQVEVLVQAVSSAQQFGSAQRVVVSAGAFASVPLSGLAEGDYAIFLDAATPIFAGLFNPVALEIDSFDFAWLAPGEVFTKPFAIAASNQSTSLALANPGVAPVTATVSLGSRQLQIRLAARSQQIVSVPPNVEIRVDPAGDVVATLRIISDGYAHVQPRESLNLASEIQVRIR